MKYKVLTIGVILLGFQLNAQVENRANIWYFSNYAGLDFNYDPPEVLFDGQTFGQCSSLISDSLGNIIMYTDGKKLFNSEHVLVDNGYDLISNATWQGNVIVPVPESSNLYYIFLTTRAPSNGLGLFYCLVDMSYNSGHGIVLEKNIPIGDAWDASTRVLALKHQNNKDYWVITRKFINNGWNSFLVTSDGVDTNAIFSPSNPVDDKCLGYMKISPDKEYILSSYNFDDTEVYRFDAASGKLTFLHTLSIESISGIEFSPDSRLVYMTSVEYDPISEKPVPKIYQYEMQYIEDPPAFRSSAILIGQPRAYTLQLARNGKIYCSETLDSATTNRDYIGVINNPWVRGPECNYVKDAIDVSPGQSHYGLPNVVMDYNLRFFFEGDCEGTPFTFQHNFLPVPDSIEWNFGDTLSGVNNISNELNPTHVFSDGGEYEVSVDVWYPSGRFEHTSRMVQVTYAPWPDLGPDLEICYGEEVTLTANGGPGYHTWNTGSHDTSIIVSDTGWYWVKIKNTAQCTSIDSIYIGYSENPAIDSSNLVITPTGCGGSTGSIEGLQFFGNGPFSYLWTDDAGNSLDTTIDLYNLPVGNYTLFVTDTNACQWPFGPFTIEDGGDINILEVIAVNEHCAQQDGRIQIMANSAYTDQFIYSIDNGNSYFDNEGLFTNLTAGSYAIRVQDTAGCESAWSSNPVELQNQQPPQVEDTLTNPATDEQANGSITIDILGAYDTLYYQIEGLTDWQINDSTFTGLAAGYYTVKIQDKYGCQTTITVEVPEIFTIKLEAVAGEDEACPGNSAFVPLTVHNFEDVAEFQMTLYFNDSLLECTGFSNAHAQLESNLDVQLFPAEAKVQLHWSGNPQSLPGASVVADLVFTAESTGLSQVAWDGQEGASWFKNAEGSNLPDSFQIGQVRVYNDIELSAFTQPACEGDEFVLILSNASGGNGNINYEWTTPSGDQQEGGMILLETATTDDAGLYTVTATDVVGCTATAETELIVNPLPQAGFADQDTIPFSEALELDAGPGQQHYQWNTGDTTQSITITEEGWYKVELTSPHGCTSIDSVYALNIYLKLYIPNAFSPNGDGMNDQFKVVLYSSYIPKFSMEIYNRWGQLIYQSNDPLQGWNGKVNGKDSPMGAYVYRIVYEYIGTGEQRKEEVRMGSFVLVR